MSFDPLSAAFDLGKVAIEKIWPDPTKRAQELRLLEELRQKGDIAELNAHVQLMLGQLEINKAEAKHPNIFVSGWRPGVGWVCVLALGYTYIIYPFMLWAWAIADNGISPPPPVDVAGLYPLLLGMLGIGAMRSHDKRAGVDTKRHE